jgi:hypothetical protein
MTFPRASLSFSAAGLATLLACLCPPAVACVEGDLRGDIVRLDKEVGDTPQGERASMQIVGAGWFRAATVVKDGGTTGQTWVTLELDGEPMITTSFSMLANPWFQLSTDSISASVRVEGNRSTMTIWYSPELKFRALASLRVEVKEEGVEHLRVSAIMNKPAPHEHVPGQPGTAVALPAFK